MSLESHQRLTFNSIVLALIFTFFLGYFTLDHSPNIFYRPDICSFRGLGAVFKPEMKSVRNCLQSGISSVDGGCIILKNRISSGYTLRTARPTFSLCISQYILLFMFFGLPSYSIHMHRSDTKIGLYFGIKPLLQ